MKVLSIMRLPACMILLTCLLLSADQQTANGQPPGLGEMGVDTLDAGTVVLYYADVGLQLDVQEVDFWLMLPENENPMPTLIRSYGQFSTAPIPVVTWVHNDYEAIAGERLHIDYYQSGDFGGVAPPELIDSDTPIWGTLDYGALGEILMWVYTFTRTGDFVLTDHYNLSHFLTQNAFPEEDKLLVRLQYENPDWAEDKAVVLYALNKDDEWVKVDNDEVETRCVGLHVFEVTIDRAEFVRNGGVPVWDHYIFQAHMKTEVDQLEFEDPSHVVHPSFTIYSPNPSY